jgi:hypothetical protein
MDPEKVVKTSNQFARYAVKRYSFLAQDFDELRQYCAERLHNGLSAKQSFNYMLIDYLRANHQNKRVQNQIEFISLEKFPRRDEMTVVEADQLEELMDEELAILMRELFRWCSFNPFERAVIYGLLNDMSLSEICKICDRTLSGGLMSRKNAFKKMRKVIETHPKFKVLIDFL